jgi:hypothetical protein
MKMGHWVSRSEPPLLEESHERDKAAEPAELSCLFSNLQWNWVWNRAGTIPRQGSAPGPSVPTQFPWQFHSI